MSMINHIIPKNTNRFLDMQDMSDKNMDTKEGEYRPNSLPVIHLLNHGEIHIVHSTLKYVVCGVGIVYGEYPEYAFERAPVNMSTSWALALFAVHMLFNIPRDTRYLFQIDLSCDLSKQITCQGYTRYSWRIVVYGVLCYFYLVWSNMTDAGASSAECLPGVRGVESLPHGLNWY